MTAGANVAARTWNRNNPKDPVCVFTMDLILAGLVIGREECGEDATSLFAGGYAACLNHTVAVREAVREVLK